MIKPLRQSELTARFYNVTDTKPRRYLIKVTGLLKEYVSPDGVIWTEIANRLDREGVHCSAGAVIYHIAYNMLSQKTKMNPEKIREALGSSFLHNGNRITYYK